MKPRLITWTLLALAAVQSVYFYPQLPDTMASHFNGSGRPNGWSSKPVFFGLYFVLVMLMLGISQAVPALVARYPFAANIPNKDYWLSADRLERTIAFLRAQFEWLGVATLLMMILVIQLVIEANLKVKCELPSNTVWLLLGAYLTFMLIWVVRLIARFARKG